ncbi:HSP20-like chaperone [Guyanagaster necrorhizus]|uniref:HSP20-like chaperone n=1 Tax=Guyanagaster necrorhizus TaxID=856835 RepID=A0A9P7VQC6_9AGAR|nr:HSP20-like chaperone [Guyanagaster necrorhizus MCA 3950]KAG7444760.1 HSP20-like chaperone [Guyanagaster necrorhizus MCA 3950]
MTIRIGGLFNLSVSGSATSESSESPESRSSGTLSLLSTRFNLGENEGRSMVTTSMAVPGMTAEDVQVNVRDGQLTVSSERTHSLEEQGENYSIRKRSYKKFSQTLSVPEGIKEDEIKTTVENGMLTVTFPKPPADGQSGSKSITAS